MVAFYTNDYFVEYENLLASCIGKNIELIGERIDERGGWQKDIAYKPELVLKYLESQEKDVVYVDADATVEKDPELFDRLDCDIAFHRLQGYANQKNELLGGTLFFKNNDKTRSVCREWVQ